MDREAAIPEIVRRLVEYYNPERIYLFGSVARGEAGPDSDLDFCVVLPDDAPKELYGGRIHSALSRWGIYTAMDIIPFPATEFDSRAAHVVSSLPATVVQEGRIVYDARRVAARGDPAVQFTT
jgi:uncharacterized protein